MFLSFNFVKMDFHHKLELIGSVFFTGFGIKYLISIPNTLHLPRQMLIAGL